MSDIVTGRSRQAQLLTAPDVTCAQAILTSSQRKRRPDAQKRVHEEGGFLVVDGGCFFDGLAIPCPVRLLLSAAAPDIVQSAVAFDVRRGATPDLRPALFCLFVCTDMSTERRHSK